MEWQRMLYSYKKRNKMENWDNWENAYWEFKRKLEPEFNYFISTEESFMPKDKYALWGIVPTHYLQCNPYC